MKERFTYEMPSPTATALVGLSHRGSRVKTHTVAAMRQPYGGPMGVFAVVEHNGDSDEIHYVYKDNLGSWTTITDAGGVVEREQSFDAWGNLRNPETWSGDYNNTLMFDRGYTGHEHLYSFGLINMNGRVYDPVMSSFLSPDNYIQAPDFSQNFNRYAYCLNNPLKYTDPSGEELCTLAVLGISAAIGAAVSMASTAAINFVYDRPLYEGLGRAAIVGALQGAFSFGIGSAASVVGAAVTSATSATWGTVAQVSFQALAHGMLAGSASEMRNEGSFWQGFASGAAASLISGAVGGVCGPQHLNVPVVWAKAATIAAGGIAGGVSSKIAGGDFIDGLCNGLICAGLNHALHYVAKNVTGPEDPPKGAKVHSGRNMLAKTFWHYQFGGKEDLWFDASTLDLDYISQGDLQYNTEGIASINLFDHSQTEQSALALGKITLTPVGNNQFEIARDRYDFNIEWNKGMTLRNIGTAISGLLHGPVIDNIPIPSHWMGGMPCFAQPSIYSGGPFNIRFSNSVYIKP